MKKITILFTVLFSMQLFAQTFPVAGFQINSVTCENQMVYFQDTSSGNIVNWNWDFGDGGTDTAQNPTHNYLASGNYIVTLTITDVAQNTDSFTETITIHPKTPVQFTVSQIPVCSNDPYVDLNDYVDIQGGIFGSEMPVDISDGIIHLNQISFPSLPILEYLDYEYTNAEGCVSMAYADLEVFDAPSATLSVTNTTCGNTDGAINANIISPNGANESYWNTGDQNTNSISNLGTGSYYLNIIDSKDCKFVANANIVASDFAAVGNITPPTCHGGTDGKIVLNVFGGSGNFNVLWSTGASTTNLNNIGAGNYQAVITDASGCSITKSFNVVDPAPFEINYQIAQPNCMQSNGGIGQFTSQGGTSPFTYQWSNNFTTQNLINISAGFYDVVVTDAKGCTASKSFNVTYLNSPYVSVDRIKKTNCGHSDGVIEITPSPSFGEQITSILWSNGSYSEDMYNLPAGVYRCVINQTNGCNSEFEWKVELRKPPRPDICIVTVDTSTNTNLLVWEKGVTNPFDIEYYKIYRETANIGQFQVIDTVHYSNISVFNDVVASPAVRSWRYRISAVNTCGVESNLSVPHKTIHLTLKDLAGTQKRVTWDNYQGFQYSSYDLLRYTDDTGWEVIVDDKPYQSLPLEFDTPPSTNGLNYMVEVIPPGGLCTATFGKAQDYNSSRSNKPRSDFNPGDGTGDPSNGLAKFENENFAVALYPNPSDGQFEVAINDNTPFSPLNMRILDLNGKEVYFSTVSNGVNYISLNNLQSGMYFVEISDDTSSENLRIVIK
ncbi:MAG: PKD domain-containing protein [Brumimicrobium sp.]|nr:PKD domain-containing protein [Brumimicrobium sp.]